MLVDDQVESQYSSDAVKNFIEDGFELGDVLNMAKEAKKHESGKFDKFWSTAQLLLDAGMTVPDKRRHGTTDFIAPIFISLRHFHDEVCLRLQRDEDLDQGINISSLEYFRLQFTPRNSIRKSAQKYYCRFNVKWGLQTRTLRKQHSDQHYASKQFLFMKQMAQKFRDYCSVCFMDDKASIPIGSPGAPLSATRRQRTILQAGVGQSGLNSLDHDNAVMHLTPSVSILLSPPETPGGWYAGSPEIILKDAIFQPSSAFRHAAELKIRLTNENFAHPFLFLGTDGGPDRT